MLDDLYAIPLNLFNKLNVKLLGNLLKKKFCYYLIKNKSFFQIINLTYGQENLNPINSIRFYTKDQPDKAIPIPQEQVYD